jgi:hypothetical protein
MSNLEKLDLHLIVAGNDLKMNIINHMSRLNKFIFNILSSSRSYNEVSLTSNKDIQKTFIDFKNTQLIYCADYFLKDIKGNRHFYSYKLKYYDDITNNCSDGIFECVRKVSLFDERLLNMNIFFELLNDFH